MRAPLGVPLPCPRVPRERRALPRGRWHPQHGASQGQQRGWVGGARAKGSSGAAGAGMCPCGMLRPYRRDALAILRGCSGHAVGTLRPCRGDAPAVLWGCSRRAAGMLRLCRGDAPAVPGAHRCRQSRRPGQAVTVGFSGRVMGCVTRLPAGQEGCPEGPLTPVALQPHRVSGLGARHGMGGRPRPPLPPMQPACGAGTGRATGEQGHGAVLNTPGCAVPATLRRHRLPHRLLTETNEPPAPATAFTPHCRGEQGSARGDATGGPALCTPGRARPAWHHRVLPAPAQALPARPPRATGPAAGPHRGAPLGCQPVAQRDPPAPLCGGAGSMGTAGTHVPGPSWSCPTP